MNRRNFCKRMVLTAAVATVVPAVAIRAFQPPVNQGLLWHVKKSNTQTYTKLTRARIQEVLDKMNDTPGDRGNEFVVYMDKKEYAKFCRQVRNEYFNRNIFNLNT